MDENLPDYFFVKCQGQGGAAHGQILSHDSHSLGGRYVSFLVSGYTVQEGETVEIQKRTGLFGTKLVLLGKNNENHKVTRFIVK